MAEVGFSFSFPSSSSSLNLLKADRSSSLFEKVDGSPALKPPLPDLGQRGNQGVLGECCRIFSNIKIITPKKQTQGF